MTKIKLYIEKSIEQNAEIYFEKAKKLKKKIEGARLALLESQNKVEILSEKNTKEQKVENKITRVARKKEWFEKFRWFYTSENKLVIAGRDATTNDILIKKHLDQKDIVFHADIAGSPFCIVKDGNNNCSQSELKQVAQFCAANSRAFKLNLSNVDIYWVNPDQISLEAPSGEYLTKGAFMVYGKKNVINTEIKISIGLMKDNKVMGGHVEAVKSNCNYYLNIIPGSIKKSDIAKKIQKYFLKKANVNVDLDEVMQALPPGDCQIEGL